MKQKQPGRTFQSTRFVSQIHTDNIKQICSFSASSKLSHLRSTYNPLPETTMGSDVNGPRGCRTECSKSEREKQIL